MALTDGYETSDGSRPEAVALSAEAGRRWPLGAFSLLAGGDVFEAVSGKPPADGPAKAKACVDAQLRFELHGAPPAMVERVRGDAIRQLSANLQLSARLLAARPIQVDLIPPGKRLAQYGYPKAVSPTAVGLFWDDPSWPNARMALKQEALEGTPQLVFHELAHALHYLAFTEEERELIYRVLLRRFRSKAAVDEVFAIYSEREFLPGFTERDHRAPGVYGFTRQQWDEDHLFTRFVRHLYFPHKPLAGPPSGRPSGAGWLG